MGLSQVQKLQLKNAVERVLHTPGNYTGGVLEMTIVVDCNMEKEMVMEYAGDVAGVLKQMGQTFQNVYLNILYWKNDELFITKKAPMLMLKTKSFYEDYEMVSQEKELSLLYARLKMYHARSKLVIFVTEGENKMTDKEAAKASLQPFLYRRLIQIVKGEIKYGAAYTLLI